MSYLQTVSEIRTVANLVNPTGRFEHGRKVDTSQAFDGAYPLIWLYPFEIKDPEGPDGKMDNATLLIGFWQQDRPDTSVLERETIIGQMDVLCSAFMVQLRTNGLISVTGITREPQYQFYQGTLSGFAVRFNYQSVGECIDP